MLKISTVLVGIFLIYSSGFGAEMSFTPANNLKFFTEVYRQLSTHHYEKDFGEKNKAKFESFFPEIVKCKNQEELQTAVNRFLGSFPESHLNLAAPEADVKAGTLLYSGIEFLESDNHLLISRIAGDAPGKKYLRPGDEVLSINGVDLTSHQRIGNAVFAGKLLNFGDAGAITRLKIRRHGKIFETKYRNQPELRKISFFKLGNMPEIADEIVSRPLPEGGVWYFKFQAFTPQVILQFRKDLAKIRKYGKLIVDLRNNHGGLILIGANLANFMTDKKINFGELTIDGTVLKPISSPQKSAFKGEVIILIDRNSYSTAEIFAESMRQNQAAQLIGENTAGMCLASTFIQLSDGSSLQIVAGNYQDCNGTPIERIGVKPDIKVLNTPETLEHSGDAVLQKALKSFQKD